MKNIIFILLINLLFSCSSFLDDEHFYCEPEIMPVLETYEAEALKRGHTLDKSNLFIIFEDHKQMYEDDKAFGTAGKKNSIRIIKIADFYWKDFHDPFPLINEILLFHELGHIDLNRQHTENINSIMCPRIYDVYDIYKQSEQIREKYIDELFQNLN